MNFVILAAGLGSRFKNDGVDTPKPLVPVMGRPMIGRLIHILMDCHAESIHIVANNRMTDLVEYLNELKNQGLPLEVKPIQSDNSFYSLTEACRGIEGKFIAMTVDTIFPTDEFKRYVEAVEKMPPDTALMGLTHFIDDESPLYARLDSHRNIVDYRYGGQPFEGSTPIVSAGLYGISSEIMKIVERRPEFPHSLSDFQRILAAETDIKVKPFVFSKALDIDCNHDLEVANQFLSELGEKPVGQSNAKKSVFAKIKQEYRASLKSLDTEEHIDLGFYRPIGFAWACLFRKLGVSPNAVTIASIFIGMGAGVCFYPTQLWINLIGIFLLIWANSFDSADGQLARLTGQYSPLGRILDGIAGDIWFITIYAAICLRTVHTVDFFSEHHWVIWVIALVAGICHAVQAAVADRYRQLHLFFLKGACGSELDSSASVARTYLSLSWDKQFFNKLIQFLYFRYTVVQEKITPQMQRLRKVIRTTYENQYPPEKLRQEFRAQSLPLCKWENFMTFNWRTIFLFTGILIGRPWLYFIAELTIFNAVLIYTIITHERICRRTVNRILSSHTDA